QLQQGVLTHAGDRRVPGLAARADLEAEYTLLADAHGIEAPAGDLEGVAAALVDDEVRAHLVRVLGAEPAGAEIAAGLLVGNRGDQELPACGPPALVTEGRRRGGLGRDLALHVLCPAPANLPADRVA